MRIAFSAAANLPAAVSKWPELRVPMRVAGLDFYRFAPHRDRLGMPTLHAEDMTELGIGMGEMRIRLDDAAIRFLGNRQIALARGQVAKPPPCLGQIRRQLDRLGRRADSVFKTPGPPERLAQFKP